MISKTSSVISLVVSSLGTGILYMPASFKLLGYGYAFVTIILIGFLTYFTLYTLAYSATVKGRTEGITYSALAGSFSPRLRVAVDVTLIASNAGIAASILRFFCQSVATFLAQIGAGWPSTVSYFGALGFALFLVIFLARKDSIAIQGIVSKISLCGVFFYLGLVIYYALYYGHALSDISAMGTEVSAGFGNFIFAMHCQFSFLSIFNQMEDQSLSAVSTICISALLLATFIYGCSGFFGYKAVGNAIGSRHILEAFADRKGEFMQRIARESFDKYGVLPGIAQVFFLFISFWAVIFLSMPAARTIRQLVFGDRGQKYSTRSSVDNSGRSRTLAALGLAIIYLLLCAPVNLDINIIIGVSAALFTAPLSFGYPSLFMILVSKRFSLKSNLSFGIIVLTGILALSMLYRLCINA